MDHIKWRERESPRRKQNLILETVDSRSHLNAFWNKTRNGQPRNIKSKECRQQRFAWKSAGARGHKLKIRLGDNDNIAFCGSTQNKRTRQTKWNHSVLPLRQWFLWWKKNLMPHESFNVVFEPQGALWASKWKFIGFWPNKNNKKSQN